MTLRHFPGRSLIVHGTPITPNHLLDELKGSSFCVSFERPDQLARCIDLVGENEMLLLDNGAFSAWRQGRPITNWMPFFDWANEIQARVPQAIAIIPDVIGGSEQQNLELISLAVRYSALRFPERAMPVWHMNESFDMLKTLCRIFNFVGWGSCAEYDIAKHPQAWEERAKHAMLAVDWYEIEYGARPWIHLLRGLGRLHDCGFDSADSTNIARNHNRYRHQDRYVGRFHERLDDKIHGPQSVRGRLSTSV
jgi:hypothetical protein